MKKVLFIAVCIVSAFTFTSCGSTAPCGLSQNTKEIKIQKTDNQLIKNTSAIVTV